MRTKGSTQEIASLAWLFSTLQNLLMI